MTHPDSQALHQVLTDMDELHDRKVCTGCGVNKSLNDYYADNRTKDGKATRFATRE